MGIIPPPTWPQATRRHPRHRPATISLLVAMLLLAGCALPWAQRPTPTPTRHAATPTATPHSPLADRSVYWSSGSLLMALRANDGALRWKVGDWSGPLPGGITYIDAGPDAPTLVDGMLYANVPFPSLEVDAYSAADGVRRWHTPLEGCFKAVGSEEPPIVAGGLVYVAASGHDCAPSGWVYGLHARDGTVAWRAPFERSLLPAHALQDGVLFIGSSTYPAFNEQDYLTALRASDGARLWRQSLDIYAYYVAAGDGMALIGGSFGPDSGGVEARRASDGAVLWRYYSSGQYDTPEPFAIGDSVYFSGYDGTFYALRASDGVEQWRFSPGARGASPPAVAGDLVYVGAGSTLYGLSTRTGAIMRAYHPFADLGRDDTSSIIFSYSAPVIRDGVIFFAATAHPCGIHCEPFPMTSTLFALDAATGAPLWTRTESPGLPLALTLGP